PDAACRIRAEETYIRARQHIAVCGEVVLYWQSDRIANNRLARANLRRLFNGIPIEHRMAEIDDAEGQQDERRNDEREFDCIAPPFIAYQLANHDTGILRALSTLLRGRSPTEFHSRGRSSGEHGASRRS